MNLNESAAWLVDNRAGDCEAPFKSSTHVILLEDAQPSIDHLLLPHINATKDDFVKLELLAETDRSTRSNVIFIPVIDVVGNASAMRPDGQEVVLFPSDLTGEGISISKRRWPRSPNPVVFDFRSPQKQETDKLSTPTCTF
jgi:hypothetical protein